MKKVYQGKTKDVYELENGNAEKAAPEVREVPLDEDATEEEFQ